jgi:hypothetical protein
MRSRGRRNLIMLALIGCFTTIAADVYAIIGRPLTPMSVAGVARRSVRRSYYYGGGYGY